MHQIRQRQSPQAPSPRSVCLEADRETHVRVLQICFEVLALSTSSFPEEDHSSPCGSESDRAFHRAHHLRRKPFWKNDTGTSHLELGGWWRWEDAENTLRERTPKYTWEAVAYGGARTLTKSLCWAVMSDVDLEVVFCLYAIIQPLPSLFTKPSVGGVHSSLIWVAFGGQGITNKMIQCQRSDEKELRSQKPKAFRTGDGEAGGNRGSRGRWKLEASVPKKSPSLRLSLSTLVRY